MREHYIKPEEAVTLHGLFLERVRRTPADKAYCYFDTQRDAWRTLSWGEMHAQVARWQAALQREELAAGDRVAIMLRNCPQWVMYEQAALSLGLVLVPLYVEDRPDNIAYIVNDARVRVLFFETAAQWQGLSTVLGQLACVQRFVSLENIAGHGVPHLQHVESWLPAQAEMQPERSRNRDALACIMYTSGTTGKPKGVMSSHHNIIHNAYGGLQTCTVHPHDSMLSFLPLSHAFERTAGYYMSMMAGASVAYARSIPLLADDLKIIRPTILVSVPRIYERIYNAIHAKLEEASPLRRKLFTLAVNVGWERFEYQQGRGKWSPKFLLWPVLKKLVADKLMERLGGRLRLSISGGAALPPKVSRLFIALGLPLIQGYGMTETSPVVSINRVGENLPSTVGQPLPGIEVRIGEQNALLVKGPCNMLGLLEQSRSDRRHDRQGRLAQYRRHRKCQRQRAYHHHGTYQGNHRHVQWREIAARRHGKCHSARPPVRAGGVVWRRTFVSDCAGGAQCRSSGKSWRDIWACGPICRNHSTIPASRNRRCDASRSRSGSFPAMPRCAASCCRWTHGVLRMACRRRP